MIETWIINAMLVILVSAAAALVVFLFWFLILFGISLYYDYIHKPSKVKSLEELTDKELFMLDVAVSNEVVRRGAALIEPFEEFKKK